MDRSRPEALRDLADAERYLDGLINRERQTTYSYVRLDLAPIRALLERIGHPESGLSILHVAGSKGKGSTCLFAEAILRECGESVGTFTSPHLESWAERFRIDGEPVSTPDLLRAVELLRPHVDALRVGPRETVPSFFDVTTAIALWLFAQAGVDRVVLEVGLGGRLDSTNAVSPEITCITSIELEHTDKLGDTEALIASEKAGILKSGVPAVLGALSPEAGRVIRDRAHEVDADVWEWGADFRIEAVAGGGDAFVYRDPSGFTVPLHPLARGEAARLNAALAIALVRRLGAHEPTRLAEAAGRAIAGCVLPGRMEILQADPQVIVDAAHTVRSAEALARFLESIAPDGVDLVLSVSGDKSLDSILAVLLPRARRVWCTRADVTRSMPPADLAQCVESVVRGQEVEVVEDPEAALCDARRALPDQRMLCATGSVYLAGIARRVLG